VTKRSVSLKAIIQDMQNGMDEERVKEKYGLKDGQLQSGLQKAVDKGVLTQKQVDTLRARAAKQTSQKVSTKQAPAAAAKPLQPTAARKEAPPAVPRQASQEPPKVEPPKPVTQPVNASPIAPHPGEEVRPRKRSKRKLPIIAIVICVLLVGFILMVKFLPWWLSIVITVVVVFGTVLMVKFLFKKFFMGLFGAKGGVLAGATAQVHGISQAPFPEYPRDDEDEDDAEDEEEYRQNCSQFNWYYLDVTITPTGDSEEFTHWEPGDVVLAGMDAKAKDLEDEEDQLSMMADYKIFSDGKFVADEGGKHPGSQRIRFHVGVKPGVETLQFRYYFELFGRVSLPQTPPV
jgi:hypothetical protein